MVACLSKNIFKTSVLEIGRRMINSLTCISFQSHTMSHFERLSQIRALMAEQNIAAYIIPSSDPHISEYLPERYKCIQ
jgi:hypothetical protein